ncbi:MAG: orotidine-5'-phosphate decarboxylase [Chitinophagaceae bacterium]|nr:orotidine-5'-phosphate decarboxylase [Chitinophagaceae bacterium]MCW5913333.1 orotidine-5'-phosphate decarboxylase [Chitinophagaceae bacterium]
MNRQGIIEAIRSRKSCLCVGLDPDMAKLPGHLPRNAAAITAFNKEIIDATRDLCVAYKLNTAFYEVLGATGWKVMEETVGYIGNKHFLIADAKRGDIGNTSAQYAKAFLENMPFDAITVSPYMGSDSIQPFLGIPEKWVIILGLTSNKGSIDFQKQPLGDGHLWERVLQTTSGYGSMENLMYVIGATQATDLKRVREILPGHFLLIPGVGTQGGSVAEVMANGCNRDCGLLINVSRSIMFAGGGHDFAIAARQAASRFQNEMKDYL